MPGAVDALLLSDDLRRRGVDVLADDVDALLGQRFGGGALLHRIVHAPVKTTVMWRSGSSFWRRAA